MNTTILIGLGVGFAFAFWPVISGWSGVSGAWSITLVLIGSLLGNSFLAGKTLYVNPAPTSILSVALVTIAGIINGVALYYYGGLIESKSIPVAVIIGIVMGATVIFGASIDFLLRGVTLSSGQTLCLIAIASGIYGLNALKA